MAHTLNKAALLASAAMAVGIATPARAQSDARINAIQSQIQALNAELQRVKRDLAARDATVRAAQADAATARAQSQQTQDTVAHLPMPPGFASMGDAKRGPSIGIGYAHPEFKSPKTDFTSLNASGISAEDQKAGSSSQKGTFHIGGITIQLGGFFAADGIFRSRNSVTDIASNWNTGIPLGQSPQYHENETRFTGRQSRLAALVQGDADADQHVSGYFELDLQGAAGTANSNESNSYNPRIRQVYTAYDNDAIGVHVLAGQAWSLATMTKVGLTPREEDLPATIDQQYVPGFSWARQPQLRIAKDFDQKYWLGLSLENPQTVYSVGANGTGSNSGTANFNNPGISTLTPGQAYSTDVVPDVIIKVAADPGFGHYELFGLGRFMQDRVSVVGNGHNNNRAAGGVGAGVILPVIASKLDFQISGLAGYGIGRYGSAQLPDATISPTGAPSPLPGVQALVGLVGHPNSAVDLYSYVGTEQVGRRSFSVRGVPYGYGNPAYSNAGCDIELSTATCTGNTSGVIQGTLGAYWRFLHGDFGTVQVGSQYAYTKRSVFRGLTTAGGSGNHGTDENTVLFDFRYLPFL